MMIKCSRCGELTNDPYTTALLPEKQYCSVKCRFITIQNKSIDNLERTQ